MSNFTDFISSGGGSASQINEVVYINNVKETVTLDDGRVYLSGGVIETDLTTYPLATKAPKLSAVEFVPAAYKHGICVDSNFATNGYYYVIGGSYSSTVLEKYNSAGTLLNSYSISAQHSGGSIGNLCFADGFIHIAGSNKVTKWSTAGVYQSQFSASSAQGVAYDGTDLYVSTSSQLRKYTLAGTLLATYTVSGGGDGLAYAAGSLWLLDNNTIKQTTLAGVEINSTPRTAITGVTMGTLRAIGTDGTNLLISDQTNGILTVTVGIGVTSDVDRTVALGSGHNYIRIA